MNAGGINGDSHLRTGNGGLILADLRELIHSARRRGAIRGQAPN
jgi:hypothetical protein